MQDGRDNLCPMIALTMCCNTSPRPRPVLRDDLHLLEGLSRLPGDRRIATYREGARQERDGMPVAEVVGIGSMSRGNGQDRLIVLTAVEHPDDVYRLALVLSR
jgi:hypothetical protein